MTTLKPFRALRYADHLDLALITAPPYDVISPEEQLTLESRDAHNVIRMTLGREHREDNSGSNKYTRAAQYLGEWIAAGFLVDDLNESFFLYRIDYTYRSTSMSSAGLVGALELEPFGTGVLPHEKTMPGPKADRLELMRTTEANLEPLWFVASEPTELMGDLVAETEGSLTIADLTDDHNVRHRVWRLEDADAVAKAMVAGPIIVADGHHRYETALTYRDERRASDGPGPWDYVLALVQDSSGFGPTLLPIHRIVNDLSLARLAEIVDLQPFNGSLDQLIQLQHSSGAGRIGVASSEGLQVIEVKDDLDTQFLSEKILGRLEMPPAYEHDSRKLAREVSAGKLCFVMSPVSIEDVIRMALAGQRMPPKTTLFWPKPRSGLLMRRFR